VTPDEIGDVADLRMSLHVNGEEWSSYSTRHMTWGFPDLVSYLSRGQTLRPGHILTSGSYPGGSALDLNRQLHAGDTIELRISRIGSLINRIADIPGAETSNPL
jgi:2-keto-4-pentenoate hydratase/2-oxohepta-3-ene-1,7-dioic acid hydratase in catechol pathway